jgi:hypothetical protein
MSDKQREIEQTSEDLIGILQSVLPASSEEIHNAMRQCMDPKELQMFDLALFCEQEMIKAQQAEAHFAACLMGASMNEALLALMCLRYESDVLATKQFGYSTRKGAARPFRDVVGEWSLEQYITVAEECEWIPSEIVNQDFKIALSEGFRELVPITHPEMSVEQVEEGAESFFAFPGTSMLRMTQTLRNAIHAGRWIRNKNRFVAGHFTEWCHFATLLSGEIRLCLLHLIMRRTSETFADQMQKLTNMLNQLPPEYRSLFEKQLKTQLGID